MTQKEKANELAYKYFPNEENIWARGNVEAIKTKAACMEMSCFIIDKACEWLEQNPPMRFDDVQNYVEQFKQAMEA